MMRRGMRRRGSKKGFFVVVEELCDGEGVSEWEDAFSCGQGGGFFKQKFLPPSVAVVD